MDTEAWIEDMEALSEERLRTPHRPKSLTVVFDPNCRLCQRCRDWMLGQASYLPMRFVPCNADEARARFGDIPWIGDELVVISESNDIWVGPAAFLTCLWALEDWREWSYRLAGPTFARLVERFFHGISAHRRTLSAFLSHQCSDGTCYRRPRA